MVILDIPSLTVAFLVVYGIGFVVGWTMNRKRAKVSAS